MNHLFKLRQLAIIILILLGCFRTVNLLAQDQSLSKEELFTQTTQNWVTELYDSLFQTDLDLINGRNHSARYPSGSGHPFFLSMQAVPGNIVCKGRYFEYPYIRYDVYNDILQLQHFTRSGSYIIDLNKTNVDGFKLNGHTFVHIRKETIRDANITPGFYELMHSGKYTYWLRREKKFSERSGGISGEYKDVRHRYIEVNNQWFRIVNRRSFLNAISDHQDELKAYLRDSAIIVKIASDEEMISVLKYCESIE